MSGSDAAAAAGRADESAGVSPEELAGLFRLHPAGVAVITADPGSGPIAMTASSLVSVSMTPPVAVFSASAASSSTPALLRADTVVIHLIDSASHEIAVLGATSGIDRFADTGSWRRLPTGEPYFVKPSRRIRARIVQRVEAGGATLFVLRALEAWNEPDDRETRQPLVYHDRTWHVLGESSIRR